MSVFHIQGKDKKPITKSEVSTFISGFSYCVLDVGAGDGKGSLRYARSHSDAAVIAIDSSFDALDKSSKAALRKPERGGTSNFMALYCDAKDIHEVVENKVDKIRIYLPWGSLLEAIATFDHNIFSSIHKSAKEGAIFEIVINAEIWRNNLPNKYAELKEISPTFFLDRQDDLKALGFNLEQSYLMSKDEIAALDTTWSAKLMSSREVADFVMAKGDVQKTSH